MKSLVELLKESLIINETIDVKELESVEWEAPVLGAFLEEIGIDSKDVEIFLSSNTDTISEYAFSIDDDEFEGLQAIEDYRKFKLLDFDYNIAKDLLTYKYAPRDFYIYWIDSGNGLRTIVFERFDKLGYYNVFGELDLQFILDQFDDNDAFSSGNLGFIKDTIDDK